MARPRKIAWQRPDIDRLRRAEAQRSPLQEEVTIPANLRDAVVEYIDQLERLIDERLGAEARQVSSLTQIQEIALNFEVESGIPTKPGKMFSKISARCIADKMSEGGHTHPDGREINEDAIDAWRKLPPYREGYVRAFVSPQRPPMTDDPDVTEMLRRREMLDRQMGDVFPDTTSKLK